MNSPIPRNNLPFQLDFNTLLLLDIDEIPSQPPRIGIPQNFILLPLLHKTHPQTPLLVRRSRRRILHNIDHSILTWRKHIHDNRLVLRNRNLVHDREFCDGRGFQVADRDELRVTLDSGFSEDHAALGGYRLAGVVFHAETLVDAQADVEKVPRGNVCEFRLADERAVEEESYLAGEQGVFRRVLDAGLEPLASDLGKGYLEVGDVLDFWYADVCEFAFQDKIADDDSMIFITILQGLFALNNECRCNPFGDFSTRSHHLRTTLFVKHPLLLKAPRAPSSWSLAGI